MQWVSTNALITTYQTYENSCTEVKNQHQILRKKKMQMHILCSDYARMPRLIKQYLKELK